MLSLLPENKKRELFAEYVWRRAIVLIIFIIATAIIALALAFPSFVISTFKERDLSAQVKTLENTDILKEASALYNMLTETKKKIADLRGIENETNIQKIIGVVLADKPAEIKIIGINFNKGEFVFRGIAKNRDSLTGFVKKVSANGLFSEVDLPVSNLARDKDIDFSIQATLKK